MLTCLETTEDATSTPLHSCRADTVRRWATEGARAFAGVQGKSLHLSHRPDSSLYRGCWFGSDRECAGYTPEGVKNLLAGDTYARLSRARYIAFAIRHYSQRFKYISTRRVCEVLKDLGCGNDVFYYLNPRTAEREKWTANKMLARRAVTTNPSEPCNWVARNVTPIDYIGGPPNKWGVYHGSLRSLMIDRFAASLLLGGLNALNGVFKISERYAKRS